MIEDTNWFLEVWAVVSPVVDTVVWPALGVIAVLLVRRFLGERAAQILQEMLQSAAKRAAGKALAENTNPLSTQLPSTELVATGVTYLKKTMPDTIETLKVSDDKLKDIVTANVGILMSPSEKGAVK